MTPPDTAVTRGPRTVAVLGLGAMGGGMARALLAAGFRVVVHNRTTERAEPLADAGAVLSSSAEKAAAQADVLLLSLSDEHAVEQVLFGEAVWRLRPGTVVINASTVSPAFARQYTLRLAASGCRAIEVAVIGNPQMARAGTLRVFVAGDEGAADSAADVLAAIGSEVRHVGAEGRAGALKLAMNLLLGVQTAALAEAVAFAESAGLDRDEFLDVVDRSGWRSPVLAFRGDFMRRRRYTPAGFRSNLMRKDLRLALDEGAARRLGLPLVALCAQRYDEAVAAGHGDDDAAVLVEHPAPATTARPETRDPGRGRSGVEGGRVVNEPASSPAGTAPSGTAPSGTAPSGTAPSGTAPSGTTPTGVREEAP